MLQEDTPASPSPAPLKSSRLPQSSSWVSLLGLIDDRESDPTCEAFLPDVDEPTHLASDVDSEAPADCSSEAVPNSEIFQSQVSRESNEFIGIRYSAEVRKEKIAKYKAKLSAHRAKVPIARSFKGRSKVAKEKIRVNGKFIRLS